MFGNILKAVASSVLAYGAKKVIDRIFKKTEPNQPAPEAKVHPWRLCPIGEHWVTPHLLHVPVSEKNPEGITTRNTGCRKNPVRGPKQLVIPDYLHPDEIHSIADYYFKALTGPPAAGKLDYLNSDSYDHFIRGWTKYWNEVFQPKDPLDPNVVKALISTESSFIPDPAKPNAGIGGKAHGFLQLTDQTIHILKNPAGELTDHLIEMTTEDAADPNIAICAAIRWLFHKKNLARSTLKREPTWFEAVAAYKDYLDDIMVGKKPKNLERFKEDLEKLKK